MQQLSVFKRPRSMGYEAMFLQNTTIPTISETHARVAMNVRAIRHLRKLTQQELATISQVSIAMIQHIENHRRYPRAEILERIANALQCSVQRLFAAIDLPRPAVDMTETLDQLNKAVAALNALVK